MKFHFRRHIGCSGLLRDWRLQAELHDTLSRFLHVFDGATSFDLRKGGSLPSQVGLDRCCTMERS